MEIKPLNEVYKMTNKEFWDYESRLFGHSYLVREEGIRRMKKEEK